MKKEFFLIFLVTCSILLAGCGDTPCRDTSDCESGQGCVENECGKCKNNNHCDDDNECTTDRCVMKKCQHKPIKGCYIGDGRCDISRENPCTSPKDCGKCEGGNFDFDLPELTDEHYEYSCDGMKVCAADAKGLKATSVEDKIAVAEGRTAIATINAKYNYDVPYNVDKTMFNTVFKLEKKESGIGKVRVDRIKLVEHTGEKNRRGQWINDNPVTLVSKSLNRVLWDENTEIDINNILDVKVEELASIEKTLAMEVYIIYEKPDRQGVMQEKEFKSEKEFEITFVNPTRSVKCVQSECNDNNPCTTDRCAGNFCVNEVRNNCLGNYICETGENSCSAPQDCGFCDREIGENSAYACERRECVSVISSDVQTKRLRYDMYIGNKNNPDMGFTVYFGLNDPFELKKDGFTVDFEVDSKKDEIGGLNVTKVELLEGTAVIGSYDQKMIFTSSGVTQTAGFSPVSSYSIVDIEKEIEPTIKVSYTYEKTDIRNVTTSYTKTYDIKTEKFVIVKTGVAG